MDEDDVIITVAKRTVLRGHKIWREFNLKEKEPEYVVLLDSISQEEFRRFVDFCIIDPEGYITKTYPNLPRIVIRPRTSC
ncbi:MAG: hypothetical protein IBV52_07955 [Candidatus Bathyarchaeota archaeon]